jgi:hypothetical protein
VLAIRLATGLLVALLTGHASAQESAGLFAREYPEAWKRLLEVYGNGTFEVLRADPQRGEQETLRIKTRLVSRGSEALSVRVDFVDAEGTGGFVLGPQGRFTVRSVGAADRFGLRFYKKDVTEADWEHLWGVAVNEGWLPLVVVGFIEQPLVDYLLHSKDVEIVREGWEEFQGRQTSVVEVRQFLEGKPPVKGKFWFLPDAGWVLLRWHWPYQDPSARYGNLCELSYGETVRGVAIVQSGRWLILNDGVTRWEAKMVSYQLEPPPEEEFRLAAFGLPEPAAGMPGSRLWLWTLTGLMGLLTALLLWRPVGKRSGAS